jgi:hypothetical protein
MIPWEGLFVYALILVGAALFGWLPFVLLERISMVDRIDTRHADTHQSVDDTRVVCPVCGRVNHRSYDYCGCCGGKIITGKT